MHHQLLRAPLLAVALLSAPAVAAAQGGPPQTPPSAETMRAMQTWYAELQEIGQRLTALQQQVMQDAALRGRQEAIAQELKESMLRADPQLATLEARARVLEGEARQAQQSNNQAAFGRLMEEAQQIQRRVVAAQGQAMQSGGLGERIQSFEAEVRARMAQIEPTSPQLIQRAEALQARIQDTMRRQQGGSGPR